MTFRVGLKGSKKSKNNRLKFNLDKLKDPNISSLFEARIGGKFGPLLLLECDAEAITNNFNEVMTEVATDILGFSRPKTQPWATDDILNMCDTRRLLKPQRKTPRGKIEYRKVNKQINKGMKEAKQKWIDDQCEEIEYSIATNNTKKAFKLVKTLTKPQQSKVTNIQVLLRTVHFSEQRRPSVLICQEQTEEGEFPILRQEVESALKTLKCGKAAGVDNVPAELITCGGQPVVDVLHAICNKIWETGKWPSTWTQSIIITIHKKGNLQMCNNYRTISLISHGSKVMLKINLNRLKSQTENIIAEEQAGFRHGRSTIEHNIEPKNPV